MYVLAQVQDTQLSNKFHMAHQLQLIAHQVDGTRFHHLFQVMFQLTMFRLHQQRQVQLTVMFLTFVQVQAQVTQLLSKSHLAHQLQFSAHQATGTKSQLVVLQVIALHNTLQLVEAHQSQAVLLQLVN